MKKNIKKLFVVPILLLAFALGFFTTELFTPSNACSTRWVGEVDKFFAERVRDDLQAAQEAKCRKLTIVLMSPGGSVIWSVEASQEMKRARAKGLILEIHGRSLVASGATLIIAAGSPGSRFIASNSLTLIHGVQRGGGFLEPPICVDLPSIAMQNNEEAKILRRVLTMIVSELSDSINKKFAEVEQWFRCGKEQAGPGSLLVELGIADKEEK